MLGGTGKTFACLVQLSASQTANRSNHICNWISFDQLTLWNAQLPENRGHICFGPIQITFDQFHFRVFGRHASYVKGKCTAENDELANVILSFVMFGTVAHFNATYNTIASGAHIYHVRCFDDQAAIVGCPRLPQLKSFPCCGCCWNVFTHVSALMFHFLLPSLKPSHMTQTASYMAQVSFATFLRVGKFGRYALAGEAPPPPIQWLSHPRAAS